MNAATGHGVKRAENWVEEAREQLADSRAYLRNLEPFIRKDGSKEKREDFERRKRTAEKRVENREKVLRHLQRKLREARKEKREDQENDSEYRKDSTAIVTFDGKPCVESAAYWLAKSRANGWIGILVSGYRTPEYSEQLCQNMCGAPSCPGLCAGRATNHAKFFYPGPAVDVSDYTNFERIQFEIGSPLRNDLPIDPVHFSPSGH